MVEINVATIFMVMGKVAVGRKMLVKTNEYFRKVCY